MQSTGSLSSRKASASRQPSSKPTRATVAASWASRVSRMTSRWQAASLGSAGSVSCSKVSDTGTSAARSALGSELVVTALHEQPPPAARSGATIAATEGSVGRRVGGREECPPRRHPERAPPAVAWATRASAAAGSAGTPKKLSTQAWLSGNGVPDAATTPSGVGSSAYRTAHTHAGRRQPCVNVSSRCSSPRRRSSVGDSTAGGLAASRARASSTEPGWKNSSGRAEVMRFLRIRNRPRTGGRRCEWTSLPPSSLLGWDVAG